MPSCFEINTDVIHPDHLGQIVLDNLDADPDAIMQIDGKTGVEETRRSLKLRSIRFARHMMKLGLKRGDVFTLCVYNSNDTVLPLMAGFYIGVAMNAVDMKNSKQELAHMVEMAKSKMIFCETEIAEIYKEICDDLKIDIPIVVYGKTDDKRFISIYDFYKDTSRDNEEFKLVNFDPATTYAYVLCTSGSTGLPKGACHTHSKAHMQVKSTKKLFNGFCMLQTSSLYWLSGIAMTLLNLTASTTKINGLPFTEDSFIEYVQRYKPNMITVTPLGVRKLLAHPEIGNVDFSSMRIFMIAGATINYADLINMKKYVKHGNVINSYGLAECGGPVTHTSKNDEDREGSCGKIIPFYEKKIIDIKTGVELKGPNQSGELYVRGSCIMKEYCNNPEATAEAIDAEGWFKTGDIIKIDEDGYVYIVDRLKEFFKSQDYAVYPAMIERVLINFPGVAECAVIGIEDKDLGYGHKPLAFIKREENSSITADDIKNEIKDKLAFYCELRGGVVFVNNFEMTPSGKIKRSVLKDLLPSAKIE